MLQYSRGNFILLTLPSRIISKLNFISISLGSCLLRIASNICHSNFALRNLSYQGVFWIKLCKISIEGSKILRNYTIYITLKNKKKTYFIQKIKVHSLYFSSKCQSLILKAIKRLVIKFQRLEYHEQLCYQKERQIPSHLL